ncbi:uncharacterized protein BYT42DRAFT_571235 [Radiomyces spectabilis]|uniref:uncharacterized protein n=1 Tax=Radiomyces spectabilis TaxID=64574 RepID=UPI002220897E|nr:uncharacterized protein BYT42DRAFT_571235 [Radiomyces spectabilis]KAI8377690.1 hypothetical protein BYT42DRAFT_571235 [Radiomyces spectabilis]
MHRSTTRAWSILRQSTATGRSFDRITVTVRPRWPICPRSIHCSAAMYAKQDSPTLVGSSVATDAFETQSFLHVSPEVTIDVTDKPLKHVWKEYCDRVDNKKRLTEKDFLQVCNLLKKSRSAESVKRLQAVLREIHQRVLEKKLPMSTFIRCCNMLIMMFIERSDLKTARLVFDGMVKSSYHPNSVTVCTLIDGMARLGSATDLHNFYQFLKDSGLFPKSIEPYLRLIKAFSERGDIKSCQYYFAILKKQNNPRELSVYHAMIKAYAAAQQPEGVLALYREMLQESVKPDLRIYGSIVQCLQSHGMSKEANEIWEDVQKTGLPVDTGIYSSLGLPPMEILERMRTAGVTPSIRDFNNLINTSIKENNMANALEVFRIMRQNDIPPDLFTYSMIIDIIAKDHEQPPETAFDLYEEMKTNQIQSDAIVYTSLIMAASRGKNPFERGLWILEEMQRHQVKPNSFTFSALLALLVHKRLEPKDLSYAETIREKMRMTGIEPNTRFYNTYLSLLAKFVATKNGQQQAIRKMTSIFKQMKHSKDTIRRPDFATYAVLITSLLKAGQIRQALLTYEASKTEQITMPVVVYNNIMQALEKDNQLPQVMNIWQDMKMLKIRPNADSYELALEACAQLGLTESFAAIRTQRKTDFQRLEEINTKKQTIFRDA